MFSSYVLSIWQGSRKVEMKALHWVEVDKIAMGRSYYLLRYTAQRDRNENPLFEERTQKKGQVTMKLKWNNDILHAPMLCSCISWGKWALLTSCAKDAFNIRIGYSTPFLTTLEQKDKKDNMLKKEKIPPRPSIGLKFPRTDLAVW